MFGKIKKTDAVHRVTINGVSDLVCDHAVDHKRVVGIARQRQFLGVSLQGIRIGGAQLANIFAKQIITLHSPVINKSSRDVGLEQIVPDSVIHATGIWRRGRFGRWPEAFERFQRYDYRHDK